MIKERFEFVLTVAYLLCLVLLGLCIEESYYILAEHLFNSTAKTAIQLPKQQHVKASAYRAWLKVGPQVV